jgi:hypothetical protein
MIYGMNFISVDCVQTLEFVLFLFVNLGCA